MKINSEVRYASHPDDVKHYDTARLREHYLVEKVFSADEINLVYTMHDRMIAGPSPQRIFPSPQGNGNIQCRRQGIREGRG